MLALTLPRLLPVLWQNQLRASSEQVAAFVHHARTRALAGQRPVRVVAASDRALQAEEQAPPSPGGPDDPWRRVDLLHPAHPDVRLDLQPAPGAFVFSPQGGAGLEAAPSTEPSRLFLSHDRLGPSRSMLLLVEPSGPMCALPVDLSVPSPDLAERCP